MRRTFPLLSFLVLFLALGHHARANEVPELLQKSGLIGTWSARCGHDTTVHESYSVDPISGPIHITQAATEVRIYKIEEMTLGDTDVYEFFTRSVHLPAITNHYWVKRSAETARRAVIGRPFDNPPQQLCSPNPIVLSQLERERIARATTAQKLAEPSRVLTQSFNAVLFWHNIRILGIGVRELSMGCEFGGYAVDAHLTRLVVDPVETTSFSDEAKVAALLQMISTEFRRWCPIAQTRGWIPAGNQMRQFGLEFWAVAQQGPGQFLDLVKAAQGANSQAWKINNLVRQREPARRAAEAQARRIEQAKHAIRNEFISKYGVTKWPSRVQLTSNPFPYQNAVIGLGVQFVRMTAQHEAEFATPDCGQSSCPDPLVAQGVPSTAFVVPRQQIVVALKVRGLRTIRTSIGETTIPDVEYLGHHQCTQANCGEFGILRADGSIAP